MEQFPVSTLLHRLCTTSQRHHTHTPIEFTHIGYHLVEDPSQKTVVDLGSRIPSLALDTSSAAREPEDQVRLRSSVAQVTIRRRPCFSGVYSTLPPLPCLQPPNWKRPSCTYFGITPPQHPPQLVVQGKDSHAILLAVVPRLSTATKTMEGKTDQFSSLRKNLRQNARGLMCATNRGSGKSAVSSDLPAARYANQDWEEKNRRIFSVEEKLFPAHTEFHMRRKTNVMRETLFS